VVYSNTSAFSKILLIQPPVFRKPKSGENNPLINDFWDTVNKIELQYGDLETETNHGLLYIAAVLKKYNYNVELLDFHLLDISKREEKNDYISRKEIKTILSNKKFENVVISCLTMNLHWALLIVKILKQLNPNCFVILGGIHPTFNSVDILIRNKTIDVIVRGEGEITVKELIDKKLNNENLEDVLGITYRNSDGKIIENPDRLFIENLDSIPFPAYELLPKNERPIVFRILTARGCEYNCNFCAPNSFWREKVRYRDYRKVVDEIEYSKNTFKAGYFLLGDLTFFQEVRYEKLCEEIIDRKLDVKWWCQSRIELITPERASLLRKAGCVQVGLGIENATQSVRNFANKENYISKIETACKYLKNNNINVQGYFMIGLPDEKLSDSIKTIKLIENLIIKKLIDITNISILVPFPGTLIHSNPELFNIKILDNDYSNYCMCVSKFLNPYPVYETKYLSRNEIRSLWELAMATATRAHKKIFNNI